MTASIFSSICNAMSLTDFYRYVLNAIHCESHCCGDTFGCECETDKVELSDDEGNENVKLLEVCCTGLKDIYTDDENEDEEELINKTII